MHAYVNADTQVHAHTRAHIHAHTNVRIQTIQQQTKDKKRKKKLKQTAGLRAPATVNLLAVIYILPPYKPYIRTVYAV